MSRSILVLLVLLAAASTTRAPGVLGQAIAVEVELEGVAGELEANVRAVSSLERAARQGGRSEATILWLFDRAPAEIELALQPFGFYKPTIDASLDKQGTPWRARFVIAPGPPTIVSAVDVRVTGPGETDQELAAAVAEFPLGVGDTLNHPLYEEGKARFNAIAAERGYLDAAFQTHEIRVDVPRASAEISLDFRSGPRYAFGPVTIHQDIVSPRRMGGYVTMQPGDPFSAQALLDLQANLEAATYIQRAEVRVERDRAEGLQVPVEVDVYPTRPARLEIGAGYGTDTGVRGTFEVLFRRLNRWGHAGTFRAEVSQIELSAAFEYEIPPIFPGTLTWSFVGGVGDFSPDWSTTFLRTLGMRLRASRLGLLSILAVSYDIDTFRIGEAEEVEGEERPPPFQEGKSNLLNFSFSSTRSVIEGAPKTSHGYRLRIAAVGASESLGSSASYFLPTLSAKWVQEILPKTRILLRAEVGQNFTDDFFDLPPSARFVAGGVESVRGFAFQSLGPKLPRPEGELVLVGGKSLLTGSFETDVIFPTGKLGQLGFAVFVDTGNALRSFSDIQLETGVGAGLRWVSPVGVVRLDGAFGVSQPGPPFRVHFSMGPDIAP